MHLVLLKKRANMLLNSSNQKQIWQGLVVCKQLGYLHASRVTTGSYFGSVSGIFSYDDVHCFGFENSLDDCYHKNVHNCGSYEGAGVVCTNGAG